MRRVNIVQIVICSTLFAGCSPVATVGYKPPIIPIAIEYDLVRGGVSAKFDGELRTPIGTFTVGLGAEVGAGNSGQRRLIIVCGKKRTVYALVNGQEYVISYPSNGESIQTLRLSATDSDITLTVPEASAWKRVRRNSGQSSRSNLSRNGNESEFTDSKKQVAENSIEGLSSNPTYSTPDSGSSVDDLDGTPTYSTPKRGSAVDDLGGQPTFSGSGK